MTGLFSLTTKQQKKLHKFFSAVAIFSLFLQIGSGIFYFKPVLADEKLKSEITFDQNKNSFSLSVNTTKEVDYLLAYRTDKQTEAIQGKSENETGSTFSKEIYAGTCSENETCVPHQVLRGILKIEVRSETWLNSKKFTIDNGSLNLIEESVASSLDLNDAEKSWLENPSQSESSPTTTPTQTQTSTITPTSTPTLTPTPIIVVGEPTGKGQINAVILKNTEADSIPLDLTSADIEQSASLVTDKTDYAPTDTALISGSGFNPNETYTLIISSTDEPPVNFEAQVTADENGTFVYAYQLDGNYRPNYKVIITTKGGKVIAQTTFTDSITVTPASGGTNIASEKAQNGSTPAYTTIGNIVITSQNNNDFAKNQSNKTLILTIPSGWVFNAGVGTGSVSGSHITFTSMSVTTTTITVTFSRDNSNSSNAAVTISGIQVQALDKNNVLGLGNILRTSGNPGTGTIAGITNDSTNFGSLSQASSSIPVFDCATDAQGANDEPGQKDLTKMCVDDSGLPNSLSVNWNWDKTGFTGANTGDACSLFDTNGDGLANYSLCVGVTNTPATFSYQALYSCGNGSASKCTATVTPITPGLGTNCSSSIENTDPFSAGEDYPNDTVASCDIDLGDVGGVSSAILIDVCSYPSGQPNSDPSDCIFFETKTGRLEVVKDLIPNTDVGLFNLQINSVTEAANVGDGGTTGEKILTTGSNGTVYTVGETAGTGTDLSNYTSSIDCKDLNGTGTTVASSNDFGPLNVTLSQGDDIVCIITNSLNQGTLTVIKHVVNDNGGTNVAGDFNITVTGNNPSPASFVGVESPGTTVAIDAGSYSVSETGPSGYSADYSAGCSGTMPAGGSATCTITNNDQAGTLTVIKHVINDNGGTKVAGDFDITVTGNSPSPASFDGVESPGTTVTLNAGSYNVTENGHDGYSDSYSTDCTGTMTIGGSKTCTITNDDNEPSLTLIKSLTKDNGGTAVESDWTLIATGPAGFSGAGPSVSNGVSFDAGTYDLSESGGPSGYTANDWVCTGGTQVDGDTVTVALGQTVTCTITNNDNVPSLTLNKILVTDNGGSASESDWMLTADGGSAGTLSGPGAIGSTDVVSGATFKAGTYTLSESTGPAGYTASSWSCVKNSAAPVIGSSITIGLGDTVTCTITNDDVAPKLTLVKSVDVGDGGDAVADDFQAYIDGNEVDWGVAQTLSVGNHTASEDNLPGYDASDWTGACGVDGSVTLNEGDDLTCYITNDDVAPTLTLVKTVSNNYGGDKQVADFNLYIDGVAATSGVAYPVTANQVITATEDSVTGYTPSAWGTDCASNGTITLLPGDTKTCTITNSDIAPTITLIKSILGDIEVNLNDFGLMIGGIAVNSGVATPVNANTPIEINETGLDDFNFVSIFGDEGCPLELGGTVTLNEGQDITCTITNEYNPPVIELLLSKTSAEIAGKTASPSDTITYELTIKNDSKSIAYGVTVQDSLPDGFSYVSGTTTGTGWTVAEPSISGNKLTWVIGQIPAGGITVINYDAQINSSQKDGSYPNVAIASGYNRKADGGIAYSVFAEFYTAVGTGISYSTSVGGGAVLGAATGQVLGAATGSPTILLIMAILMILGGLAIYFKKGRKFHV